MDIKNLEQALQLQKDLTAKMMQTTETLRAGKAPGLETLLKDKERRIASAEAELKLASRERDTALQRWNQRIERHKQTLETLNSELAALKKQASQGPKPAPKPKGGKTAKGAKK